MELQDFPPCYRVVNTPCTNFLKSALRRSITMASTLEGSGVAKGLAMPCHYDMKNPLFIQ